MKKLLLWCVLLSINPVFAKSTAKTIEPVASIKGVQITGVTVSQQGRIFVNAPRWREGVPFSVVELGKNNSYSVYPNALMNTWKLGDKITDDKFIAVQSVVAKDNKLYVLDTANPSFKGIITNPRVFVFDLSTNKLIKLYKFPKHAVKENSYINDLVIDNKNGKIYFTDSSSAGLIILDVKNNKFTRVLDNHKYTLAETNKLTINNKDWVSTVHSDGIALDEENQMLYIHALTGYTLYGIKIADLEKKDPPAFSIKTAAPDGMTIDKNGNIYFADLENHKIQYLAKDRKTIHTLVASDKIKWADSLSIYNCYLYFTNSRIHEVSNSTIKDMEFTVNKVALDNCQ